MTRTTDDWEALLDGTTPGPWEVVKCHATWKQASPEENALIPERRREFTATIATPVDGADIVATSDTYLIAAAPEAVAEVVRLREELKALRRACIESAEVSERNAEVSHAPEIHEEVAEAERDTADIITRILDGSNDE